MVILLQKQVNLTVDSIIVRFYSMRNILCLLFNKKSAVVNTKMNG